jgi:hypothetical protein
MHHRREQDEARNRTWIEMAGGACAKPQRKTAPRDQGSR